MLIDFDFNKASKAYLIADVWFAKLSFSPRFNSELLNVTRQSSFPIPSINPAAIEVGSFPSANNSNFREEDPQFITKIFFIRGA